MLGAASLAQLDLPRESRRAETMKLLARTVEIAQDDEKLRRQFAELMPKLPELLPRRSVRKPEPASWFVRTLDAPLSSEDLIELGALCAAPSRAVACNQ
jgi:hypothetical protein